MLTRKNEISLDKAFCNKAWEMGKKSLNHTEISGEIHLSWGEKKDRTSTLATPFPKILLQTPNQIKKNK